MIKKSIAILAAAMLLTGCLSENPYQENRYYSIDGPSAEIAPSAEKVDCALAILEFETSSRYSARMIERRPGNELVYREYDRWIEEPAEMVTVAVHNIFIAAQAFSYVGGSAAVRDADYCFTGFILQFDDVADEAGRRASFDFQCALTRVEGGAMVWGGNIAIEIPIAAEGPGAFAGAMSKAVSAASQKALTNVVAAIVEDQRKIAAAKEAEKKRKILEVAKKEAARQARLAAEEAKAEAARKAKEAEEKAKKEADDISHEPASPQEKP